MARVFQLRTVVSLAVCAGCILVTAAPGRAQPAVQGVVFGGAGSTFGANTLHVGGGVEVLAPQGVGVSAEIGYLTLADHFADGLGVLGAGAFAYLPTGSKSSRVRPFVVGGYGAAFREGFVGAWNAGGGVDCSMGRRHAVRLEFRDYFNVHDGAVSGTWSLRVGVVFR